jgi:D-alanyl-D-alanine carboxypeptidase
MKKLLIVLLILALLAGGLWYFREPILDLLPIDQSGWVEQDGNRYYLNEKGDPLTGWQQLEGSTRYFSADGVLHTGWLEEAGQRCYFDKSGKLLRGWQTIQGKQHCFDQDGKLMHGFLEEDGKRFYLDENGSPDIGFFTDGETTYFLLDSGRILSGWLTFAEGTYYLDENGAIYHGWVEENGKRYYFGEADGSMSTGWVDTPEGKYYLNSDGTVTSGLAEVDGVLRGFAANGAPLSGWADLDGQRYYFNNDGTLYKGWLEEDGKRYYIREDGTPAVGKLVIEDEDFFFSSTGMNFIFVNPWHSLPEDFSVDVVNACGTWLDPACQEALENMLSDCRAAGLRPQMVSGYRSIADQRVSFERMVASHGGNRESAAQVVAVPGTSEHHLGLAFDIVDSAYPKLNHQQAQYPTQKWLMEHCWEYGFILRYPENTTDITGIIWEPWHYRYVGVEMALEIRDLGGITLEEYIDNLTNDGTTCGGQKAE